MRGMKSENLLAIVDFLYFGETNVYQNNLDSFLAVAEELQLKGLMGSGATKDAEDVIKQTTPQKKTIKEKQSRKTFKNITSDTSYVDEIKSEPQFEGTVSVTDYTVAADLQDLSVKA